MDIIIKTILPRSACTVQITTTDNSIVARISISVQIPIGTVCVVIDCSWSDIGTWERDIRHLLASVINGKDGIVQCRIRGPRYAEASEIERRIREVLCDILGINDR